MMHRAFLMKKIAGWVCILSIGVYAITFWYQRQLPAPQFYKGVDLSQPKQTPASQQPFTIQNNGHRYALDPLYHYDLTGVVVSYSDADGFGNIWHHRRWKDFINVRDLCVIWNPNVTSGVYKKVDFSSDSWTCWVSWPDANTGRLFNGHALSNNHLLTDNLLIKKKLMSAQTGDVVQAKGMLVNYENLSNGYKRGTSTTRTDGGQGACETIYLTDFEVVKKAHPWLRTINQIAFWLIWLSLLEFLYFVFVTPHRGRN